MLPVWPLLLFVGLIAGPGAEMQSRPGEVTARFNRAVQLQRQGAWKQAEAEYRALLAIAPKYGEAYANLGAVLMRMDRYEEAIASYQSALRVNAKLTPVLLNIGIAHYRKGAFEKSAAALRRYLEAFPNSFRATLLLALSLVELGRDAEAVAALKREFDRAPQQIEAALRENPSSPRLHYLLGLVHLNQGRVGEAKAAFEAELGKAPTDASSLYYLASIDRSDGRLLDARKKVDLALRIEPKAEAAKGLLERLELESKTMIAGRQGTFVGSGACAECHPVQARNQNASNMARAAFAPNEHPLVRKYLGQSARIEGLTFGLSQYAGSFRISVEDGKREHRVPVEWALGAGVQGVTFFTRLGKGKYLKGLFTYYPQIDRLDLTPGQKGHGFGSLSEAAGTVANRDEAFRCLGCHSTGTVNRSDRDDVVVGELGVRCESCHGPGQLHRQAVLDGKMKDARNGIVNPRHLSPRQVMVLCGTCHIEPPADPAAVNWKDPENARFQPVGLSQSECYRIGGVSCLSCHDAHADSRRADPAYYSGVCLSCHTASARRPAAVCSSRQPQDCARCHMPTVTPFKHLDFANHWIGVYPAGPRLVPARRN